MAADAHGYIACPCGYHADTHDHGWPQVGTTVWCAECGRAWTAQEGSVGLRWERDEAKDDGPRWLPCPTCEAPMHPEAADCGGCPC